MTPWWTRLSLPLAVPLLLPACTPIPEEVTPSTSISPGSGSTSDGPMTTPGTTQPGDDVSTQGATSLGTTMGADDTTAGVSAGTAETTMGPVSGPNDGSSEGPPPECMGEGECGNNEVCTGGQCVAACDPWGPNDYTYCVTPLGTFDSTNICGQATSCVVSYDASSDIEMAVCARSCSSPCDCPPPPATGDATVSCGVLFEGGGDRCYLSCDGGEACPDGMVCRNGGNGTPAFCTHPVQPIQPYGNCDDFASGCVAGSSCATNGGNSVCVESCPSGVGVCDAPPPGGDFAPACDMVISPPAGNDCYLPCINSNNCPPGMSCVNDGGDYLCMWPPS